MPDSEEIQRIAAAMNALRPEWATRSLATFLAKHHETRPYRDLAVAAIAVAVDERTTTPQLLNQHGPWWVAAGHSSRKATETPGPGREPHCEKPGHEHEIARRCRCCRADELAGEDDE